MGKSEIRQEAGKESEVGEESVATSEQGEVRTIGSYVKQSVVAQPEQWPGSPKASLVGQNDCIVFAPTKFRAGNRMSIRTVLAFL